MFEEGEVSCGLIAKCDTGSALVISSYAKQASFSNSLEKAEILISHRPSLGLRPFPNDVGSTSF